MIVRPVKYLATLGAFITESTVFFYHMALAQTPPAEAEFRALDAVICGDL
jgi:hypothetical protein